eukprot:COSAG03_NODE_24983_length_268_cov_1.059172_2_plen_27_part_01
MTARSLRQPFLAVPQLGPGLQQSRGCC